jgi:hypothetical protein
MAGDSLGHGSDLHDCFYARIKAPSRRLSQYTHIYITTAIEESHSTAQAYPSEFGIYRSASCSVSARSSLLSRPKVVRQKGLFDPAVSSPTPRRTVTPTPLVRFSMYFPWTVCSNRKACRLGSNCGKCSRCRLDPWPIYPSLLLKLRPEY